MKKLFYLCFIALALLACKDKNVDCVTSNPYDSSVTGTCVFADNPSWNLSSGLGYSAMNIIIDEKGVPTQVNDLDKLAAFVGTSCRGVVRPFLSAQGALHFNLAIRNALNEGSDSVMVELKYYSATQKGIYTSKKFVFSEGTTLGTPLKGVNISWK